jgi:urease accessory protein
MTHRAAGWPIWPLGLYFLVPALALAHVGQGDVGGGFIAGVEHPIFGLDHVVAMVAVGIWGAQLGVANRWPVGGMLLRAGGGSIAACGVYFLAAHFVAG